MSAAESCPKHECGFWGIPLENLGNLADLSEDRFECCLWHETKVKRYKDPRFSDDPNAEDYLDPVPTDGVEDLELEDNGEDCGST